MMKCLITGATGFIGSHLVEALTARGAEIACLVRRTSNLRWLKNHNIQYHTGEVTEKESLRKAVRNVEYIFHLASLTKAVYPEDYYLVNTGGTKNILEVCAEENPPLKRFILVSSLAAAGPSPTESPILETYPPRPITDYGNSKLEAERIAAEFMSHLPITIVRPPVVYGPRERDIYFYFRLINHGVIFNAGGANPLLSIIYAPDLAEAMVRLSTLEQSAGETYFVSSPEPKYMDELTSIIASALGRKKVLKIPAPLWVTDIMSCLMEASSRLTKKPALLNRQKIREIRQKAWVCSAMKLKKDADYICPTPVEKGIAETAAWYRENGWL